MKALPARFDGYRPTPVEIEYADVIENERHEADRLDESAIKKMIVEAFEKTLPERFDQVESVTGMQVTPGGSSMWFWIGEVLAFEVIPTLPKAVQDWHEANQIENVLTDKYDSSLDDALEEVIINKYNLEW
jgi:hypothetical protein